MIWYMMKPKIREWITQKENEFFEAKNELRLSMEDWLDRYIFVSIHELFFAEFPIILYKWLL